MNRRFKKPWLWGFALLTVLLMAPSSGQQGSRAVEGVVVDALTIQPLSNVAVAVRYTKPPDGSGVISAMNAQGAVTLTGPDGRFRIEDDKSVPFRLHCDLEGYVKKTADRAYDLKPGETVKGVSIALDPEAQVAGRVTDEDTRAPLAGMRVTVLRYGALPSGGAETDAEGRFLIRSVEPGEYRLQVSPATHPVLRAAQRDPAKPSSAYQRSYYPGVSDLQTALPVLVTAGAKLNGMDVAIRKQPIFPVRGKVDSSGVDGPVTLWFSEEYGPKQQDLGTLEKPGAFEVNGLPAGNYRLLAFLRTAQPSDWRRGTVSFDIVDKPVEDLLITTLPGVRVTGEVRTRGHDDPKTDPLWRDKRESPVQVWLFPHGRALNSNERPVRANSKGGFTFEGLAMDRRRADVTGLPSGYTLRGLDYNGAATDPFDFELNPSAILHHLTLWVGPLDNSLSGTVKRNGKGVDKAIVWGVMEQTLGPWKSIYPKSAETDAEGRYTITGIPPGEYRFIVLGSPIESLGGRGRLLRGEGVRVKIEESTKATQDFEMK